MDGGTKKEAIRKRELPGDMAEVQICMRTEQLELLERLWIRQKEMDYEQLAEEVYLFGSRIKSWEDLSRSLFVWMVSLLELQANK